MSDPIVLTPERLAAFLGHAVSAALAARVQASPRGRAAFDRLLDHRFGTLPPLDPVQRHVAALDSAGWATLVLDLGAAWSARQIAGIVAGDHVRALVAAIGPERRSIALGALAHAPAPDDERPVAPDALVAAMPGNGAACLIAWCELQPAALSARLRLRLPEGLRPDARHRAQGPALVAHLVGVARE